MTGSRGGARPTSPLFATILVASLLASGCTGTKTDGSQPALPATGSGGPAVAAGTAQPPVDAGSGPVLAFDAPRTVGGAEVAGNPYLLATPDGRLAMTWTEVRAVESAPNASPAPPASPAPTGAATSGTPAASPAPASHAHGGTGQGPSATHDAFLAFSSDAGASWSDPVRLNDQTEDVQGAENLPKVAFGAHGQVYAAWSIPSASGDRMRDNTRFAVCNGTGTCKRAVTINEVKDASRFPTLAVGPDGTVYLAWIDRREDTPAPRQLFMARIGLDGTLLTTNYQVGVAPCECCRLGLAVSESDGAIYLAYRSLADDKERSIVVQKSSDGGATFGAPVAVSNDHWKVPGCPHSGPTIQIDASGNLHVTWYTYGEKPADAGIYYSVSRDGGATFSPRLMVAAAGGPTILHASLAVGPDGVVYMAWDNLASDGTHAEMYFRMLAADGRTLSPVQQLSRAQGDASRPVLAVTDGRIHVAWTETEGEASWVRLASAPARP